jgi:hypothetical protein
MIRGPAPECVLHQGVEPLEGDGGRGRVDPERCVLLGSLSVECGQDRKKGNRPGNKCCSCRT